MIKVMRSRSAESIKIVDNNNSGYRIEYTIGNRTFVIHQDRNDYICPGENNMYVEVNKLDQLIEYLTALKKEINNEY